LSFFQNHNGRSKRQKAGNSPSFITPSKPGSTRVAVDAVICSNDSND
jgi:hypothetical protein